MDFSIVTTLYHSAPYIKEFYRRVCAEFEKVSDKYEIIFVNDGSPDDALKLSISLHEKDHRVSVVDLSRNFGHHNAMLTGLSYTRGSYVFLIDVDLEEEPELFSQFYKKLKETDADVVFGVQHKRRGKLFEKISGGIFWKLFNLMSTYPVPENQLVARLMTRQYVDALLEYRERDVFLPGLWAMTGFKQIPLTAKKHSKGSSTYNLRKKINQFVNAITSFSIKPLVYIFYLGALIVTISSASALWLIIRRIFFQEYLSGWPSLIVSMWLLGGLTIFCIGLIGIYLSKVFMEAKQRPKAIIREIHEREKDAIPELQSFVPTRLHNGEEQTDYRKSVQILERRQRQTIE